MARLEIASARDAQRLRCPRGHQVAPTNRHWWCRSCANHWEDCEAEFDAVEDAATGEMLRRDDVAIDPEVPGCYYA